MNQLKVGRPSKKEKAILSVQNNEESYVRMNVNIPKEFYKKVKQYALNKDENVTEIVKKALLEYMKKQA